jgi:membrane associated rhomboid family serine protease
VKLNDEIVRACGICAASVYAAIEIIGDGAILHWPDLDEEEPVGCLCRVPSVGASVALIGVLGASGIGLPQVLMITIPATLFGIIAGTLSVAFRGKELADDPEYQSDLPT